MSGTHSAALRAGQVLANESHAPWAFGSMHAVFSASALHGRQLSPAVMCFVMH